MGGKQGRRVRWEMWLELRVQSGRQSQTATSRTQARAPRCIWPNTFLKDFTDLG